jgi:hypothetical protein
MASFFRWGMESKMSKKIYAIRMREYCRPKGHLRRVYIGGPGRKKYEAGDATPNRPMRPSSIIEVDKTTADYLTGRDPYTNAYNVSQPNDPNKPVFDLIVVDDVQDLHKMASDESNARMSAGLMTSRALIVDQAKVIASRPAIKKVEPAPVEPAPEPAKTIGEPISIEEPEEAPAPVEPAPVKSDPLPDSLKDTELPKSLAKPKRKYNRKAKK